MVWGVVVRLVHGHTFRAGTLMGGTSTDSMLKLFGVDGSLGFMVSAGPGLLVQLLVCFLLGVGVWWERGVWFRGGGCEARCWVLRDRTMVAGAGVGCRAGGCGGVFLGGPHLVRKLLP